MSTNLLYTGIIVLVLLVGAAIIFAPNFAESPTQVPVQDRFDSHIVYTTDQDADQEPLRAHCSAEGGTFNTCGSTCAPDAEFCAEVCAFTCELSGDPDVPADWQMHTNERIGFSLAHPQDLSIDEVDTGPVADGPGIQFSKWGPTQIEASEFFDGLFFTVSTIATTTDPRTLAEAELELVRQVGDADAVKEPLHETTLAGANGVAFTAQTVGAPTTQIFLDAGARIIRVAHATPDPTDQGFEKMAERMLASFTILPQSGN